MGTVTIEQAREALSAGGRLRVVVGTAEDDPTLLVWLQDGMVMSAAVAGWSAGVVEPVCAFESDFLDREYLTGRESVEVIPPTRGLRVDVIGRDGPPRQLTLVEAFGERVAGPSEPSADAPAVTLERKRHSFGEGIRARLAQPDPFGGWLPIYGEGAGPMFNGRFIWTGDSRFGEATGAGAFAQPVKLFDRWETREITEVMD